MRSKIPHSTQDNSPAILIAGASGYVGGNLVPALLKEDYSVRCMARTMEKLQERNWAEAEIISGDVMDESSLYPALQGIDIAYYLVHSMGGDGDFETHDVTAAQNFARVAAAQGVNRIIYLGGLGNPDQELSPHLASRQKVGEILAGTGIPVTELRASIIIGSGSASFEIIRDLVKKLPVMVTPRWVDSQCEPIAIDNVVHYLKEVILVSETTGKILDIGGGEVLTYAEMMRQVGEVLGSPFAMFKVPVLTPRLSAYWLNLVTAVPMSIAYPLIEGLRNDTVCYDYRIREWIPQDLIPFSESVRKATASDEYPLHVRWTDASNPAIRYEQPRESMPLQDIRMRSVSASPEILQGMINRIGGKTGWYSSDWAWQIRGAFDRLIGGVGMRRGRRHPSDIRVGDAIDFWRVIQYDPEGLLRLQAEMKLPGRAWLTFEVRGTSGEKSMLRQTASFEPRGLGGYLYWYLLYPLHTLIFSRMATNISRRAEHAENSSSG